MSSGRTRSDEPKLMTAHHYGFEVGKGKPPFDANRYAFTQAPWLIKKAMEVRNGYSSSHRGVLVGAMLVAHNSETMMVGVFAGFNSSPVKGIRKYCAEKRAINFALEEHRFLDVLFVPGPTNPEVIRSIYQPDTAPGAYDVITKTLYCCDECSGYLQDHTLVVTFGEDGDGQLMYQASSGKHIKNFHAKLSGGRYSKRTRLRMLTPEIERPAIHEADFLSHETWAGHLAVYDQMVAGIDHNVPDRPAALTEIAIQTLTRQAA